MAGEDWTVHLSGLERVREGGHNHPAFMKGSKTGKAFSWVSVNGYWDWP